MPGNPPPTRPAGSEEIQGTDEPMSALLPVTNAPTALVEAGQPEIPEEEEDRAQLRALAAKYNVTLMPTRVLLSALGSAILSKMIQRTGDSIYQIVTVTMPYFPIALLEDSLPTESRQQEAGTIWWELTSMDAMLSMIPILSSASDSSCAGLSKYFRAKSQPVFRVMLSLLCMLVARAARASYRSQDPCARLPVRASRCGCMLSLHICELMHDITSISYVY